MKEYLSNPDNFTENLWNQLLETEEEIALYEYPLKTLDERIEKFQKYILGIIKEDIIDYDELDLYEPAKKKYGFEKLREYVYDSIVRVEKFFY